MNHFVSSRAAPAPQPRKAVGATRSFKSAAFHSGLKLARRLLTPGAAGVGVGQLRGRSRAPKPAPWIPPRAVPPRLLHPTPSGILEFAGLRGPDSWRTGPIHPHRAHSLRSPSRDATPGKLLYLEWHPPYQPAGFCVLPSRLPPAHPAQLSGPLPATSPSLSHYIVI